MHHETFRESIAGLKQALRSRSVGPLFFCHLAAYSSFVLVVGLWGGPYLTHIYGYGLTERGDMLFAAVVAQIIAAFLYGPTDRIFRGYKIPVFFGSFLTGLTLLSVAWLGVLPPGWLVVWFLAIGALTAYTPVMIAHGKSLFPPHLAGRGLTILNMATMGGAFLSQTVTGFVINQFPLENGAYRARRLSRGVRPAGAVRGGRLHSLSLGLRPVAGCPRPARAKGLRLRARLCG